MNYNYRIAYSNMSLITLAPDKSSLQNYGERFENEKGQEKDMELITGY